MRFWFLFLLLIILPALARAQSFSCKNIFLAAYGEVSPIFPHTDHYDVEVFSTTEIKNQCNTSYCHLFTWAAELEKSNGVEISDPYLTAMSLYEEALADLELGKTTLHAGAYSYQSRNAIRRLGLVPTSAWKGHADFAKSNTYAKLTGAIEAILVRTHDALKNDIYLPDEKIEIRKEAEQEIFTLIDQIAGPIPFHFQYRGKHYTPKTFAETFFPELYLPLYDFKISRGLNISKYSVNTKDNTISAEVNIDRAEDLIKEAIDSGLGVYLSYTHEKQYVDDNSGIMSISAFNYPEMATVLTRDLMDNYGKWSGSHAVLVVGYELDPATGRVRKWKIQNSWGAKTGDKGYFHMYSDYFRVYAWGFSFIKDGRIEVPEAAPEAATETTPEVISNGPGSTN